MIYNTGVTGQTLPVEVFDDSGIEVTGLVAATFPALNWSRAGPNADVAFPALSDLATITAAWTAGGLKERGNGVYRLDVPDAIFSVAGKVKIRGGASGKRFIAPIIEVMAAGIIVGNVSASTPAVDTSGNFSVVAGDDYLTANGRSLDFAYSAIDLTGFSTVLAIEQQGGTLSYFPVAGSIVNPGAGNQLLRFELPTATSALLQPGSRRYQIHCTSPTGKLFPSILGGTANVVGRIGA